MCFIGVDFEVSFCICFAAVLLLEMNFNLKLNLTYLTYMMLYFDFVHCNHIDIKYQYKTFFQGKNKQQMKKLNTCVQVVGALKCKYTKFYSFDIRKGKTKALFI